MATIVELDSRNFGSFVQSPERLALVDFWAPWCGPCRAQRPILQQVAESLGDALTIGTLNVDTDSSLARSFGITGIPALLMFRRGALLDRRVGLQSAAALHQWLQTLSRNAETEA